MKPKKMSIGGKLTLAFAFYWLFMWLFVFTASAADLKVPGAVGDAIGLSLIVLSYPIASMSGALDHGQGPPPRKMLGYLVLMGPNLFLWGYSLGGLALLVRGTFRRCWPMNDRTGETHCIR